MVFLCLQVSAQGCATSAWELFVPFPHIPSPIPYWEPGAKAAGSFRDLQGGQGLVEPNVTKSTTNQWN